MLKSLSLALAVVSAFSFPVFDTAQAAVAMSAGAAGDVALPSNIEKAQFLFGGRNYCWYDTGWRGPGWYWCGYEYRTGFGWGGGYGWNHWRGGRRGMRGGSHMGGMRMGGSHMGGSHMGGSHMGGSHMGGMHMGGMHAGGGGMHMGGGGGGGHGGGGHKP